MACANTIPISAETAAVLDRFSNYLYARAGYAQSTVDLTTGFVRRMAPVIGLDPSREDVDRYIATMRRRGDSYANVTNAMKALSRYMEFLGRPMHMKPPRKPQKASMPVLSEAKVAIMIDSTSNVRERAIIALLAFSGIRNRECINLRICDVDFSQQTVTVQLGKGDKGRVCYVSGACMEILSEYVRAPRKYAASRGRAAGVRLGEPDDFLFVTVRHGHQLQTQDIRKLVRTIARRAGINRRVWPHLLRHSLATALFDRGASPYSIQALLGHAWLSTTLETYLHPTRRSVQADYCRCAPAYV